ncbi:MAG: asparagine synthase-related protein [Candidatus Omnitrophica bacterium]|nr:asparagine synthase-related protein [Candidatus Omnitrophota bacterium]
MYLKFYRKGRNFNERIELRRSGEACFIQEQGVETILEGKFYYYNDSHEKIVLINRPEVQLEAFIKKYGISDFIERVEGEYCGIRIDRGKRRLKIFSDKLKQKELYFFYNEDVFIASDDCNKIITEIGSLEIEENSLLSAVLLHISKGHTLFKNIYRLKYNEIIELSEDKVIIGYHDDRDINILESSELDSSRYEKIFKNAILSRASNKFNLVYSSGGWDSTMILAILRQNFEKSKIRGIAVKFILQDGSCFNEFEMNKLKKLSKTLDVGIDELTIDFRKKELYYQFERVSRDLFINNLFYFCPTRWAKTVDYISGKYGKDVVIFNGEGSDSLHNYGFSQHISLPHDNYDFKEYADKMKNYLFGPEFFKRIENKTFQEDSIYKIFLQFHPDLEFVKAGNLEKKNRFFYYLLSFIYSDIRVPFRKVGDGKYFQKKAIRKFERWLEKYYFGKAAVNISESNLYYYFSYLYTLFHLQSPQIRIYREGLVNTRFPFIDMNLFRFLYKMPQHFGRGLNFNHIKYPLRILAEKVLSESQRAILENGPHSYLSEVRKMNINDEWCLRGPEYEYMKDNIDMRKVLKVFKADTYSTHEIQNLIRRFQQGRLRNITKLEARLLQLFALLSANY